MAERKKKEPIEILPKHQAQLDKIGALVKQLRMERTSDSYETFAFKNGINRISQYRLETGNNFNMNTFMKVLDGLNISLAEFFSKLEE